MIPTWVLFVVVGLVVWAMFSLGGPDDGDRR